MKSYSKKSMDMKFSEQVIESVKSRDTQLSTQGFLWLQKLYGQSWWEVLNISPDASVDSITDVIIATSDTPVSENAHRRVAGRLNGLNSQEIADASFTTSTAVRVFYTRIKNRAAENLENGKHFENITELHQKKLSSTAMGQMVSLQGAAVVLEEGTEWQSNVSCANIDPSIFFPETGGSAKEAKKICEGCTVREQCLGYALYHKETYGVWGGLSSRQRSVLTKEMTETVG